MCVQTSVYEGIARETTQDPSSEEIILEPIGLNRDRGCWSVRLAAALGVRQAAQESTHLLSALWSPRSTVRPAAR